MRNHNSLWRNFALVFVSCLIILAAAVALDYFLCSRSDTSDCSDNSITFNFNFGNIKGILELDF